MLSTCTVDIDIPPKRLSKPRTNTSSSNLFKQSQCRLEPSSPLTPPDADRFEDGFPTANSAHICRRHNTNPQDRINLQCHSHDAEPTDCYDEDCSQHRLRGVARDVKRRFSRTNFSTQHQANAHSSAASSTQRLPIRTFDSQIIDEHDLIKEQIQAKVWTDSLAALNHKPPPVDEDKHPDSVKTPIRRRSLYTPGIATRVPEDILRKPPSSYSKLSQADRDYYYNPSLSQASPLTALAQLQTEHNGRSTPSDLTHLGGLKLGTLRVTNGTASPSPYNKASFSTYKSSLDTVNGIYLGKQEGSILRTSSSSTIDLNDSTSSFSCKSSMHSDSGYKSNGSYNSLNENEICPAYDLQDKNTPLLQAYSSSGNQQPLVRETSSSNNMTVDQATQSAVDPNGSYNKIQRLQKLTKQRPKSEPLTERNFLQPLHDFSNTEIPSVPLDMMAQHAQRLAKFPLLEHTYPSPHHTSTEDSSATVELSTTPPRFPSPETWLGQCNETSKAPFLTQLGSKIRAWSRPRFQSQAEDFEDTDELAQHVARFEICRSPTWSDYGNRNRRKPKQSEGMAETRKDAQKAKGRPKSSIIGRLTRRSSRAFDRRSESCVTLADWGTDAIALGGSPYDVALPTSSSWEQANNNLATPHPQQMRNIKAQTKKTFQMDYDESSSVSMPKPQHSRQYPNESNNIMGHDSHDTPGILGTLPCRKLPHTLSMPDLPQPTQAKPSPVRHVMQQIDDHDSLQTLGPEIEKRDPRGLGLLSANLCTSERRLMSTPKVLEVDLAREQSMDRSVDNNALESNHDYRRKTTQWRLDSREQCPRKELGVRGQLVDHHDVPAQSHQGQNVIPKAVGFPNMEKSLPNTPDRYTLKQLQSTSNGVADHSNSMVEIPGDLSISPHKKTVTEDLPRKDLPALPRSEWDSHKTAWSARRKSAGEALLLQHRAGRSPTDTYAEAETESDSNIRQPLINTNELPGFLSESPNLKNCARYLEGPWHHSVDKQDFQQASAATYQQHSEIAEETLTSERLCGRYEGGLLYGYEPGYGLVGSAGTRSGATRRSLHLSRRFGVDLSDVPVFVQPSALQ
ncbi:MAG: hypothetical protein LQ342_006621 [Letrouitia transgressa]|nr:MAG: hypothetical protein LQ342_006621 [Letrouitia transgressa]